MITDETLLYAIHFLIVVILVVFCVSCDVHVNIGIEASGCPFSSEIKCTSYISNKHLDSLIRLEILPITIEIRLISIRIQSLHTAFSIIEFKFTLDDIMMLIKEFRYLMLNGKIVVFNGSIPYLIGSMSLDVIESIPMLIRCSCISILLLLQYKRPPSTN